jgi:hypothetical protein
VAQSADAPNNLFVEDTDANQDALRQVEKATGSAPVGEDEELLESPELQGPVARSERTLSKRDRERTAILQVKLR